MIKKERNLSRPPLRELTLLYTHEYTTDGLQLKDTMMELCRVQGIKKGGVVSYTWKITIFIEHLLWTEHCTCIMLSRSHQNTEESTIIVLILHIRQPRHREAN